MSQWTVVIVFLSVLLAVGCVPLVQLEQEFSLSAGESVRVQSTGLTITLDGVVQDVRTAEGDEQLLVAITAMRLNETSTFLLPVGGESDIDGYTIEVSNVIEEPAETGEFTVTLLVDPPRGGSE